MNYKDYLALAIVNLGKDCTVTRIAPTQSIQAKHFQTCKFTEVQYKKYEKNGTANTIYGLDFLVKYKPENMHDNGHYICIMFRGEKVFELKRKHIFDFKFYKVRKHFELVFDTIKRYHSDKQEKVLKEILADEHIVSVQD